MANLQGIIDGYERQLVAACARFVHCRYDGGGAGTFVEEADDFTSDYGHLAVHGQRKLAAAVWPALFDFADRSPPTSRAMSTRSSKGKRVALAASDNARVSGIEYKLASPAAALAWAPAVHALCRTGARAERLDVRLARSRCERQQRSDAFASRLGRCASPRSRTFTATRLLSRRFSKRSSASGRTSSSSAATSPGARFRRRHSRSFGRWRLPPGSYAATPIARVWSRATRVEGRWMDADAAARAEDLALLAGSSRRCSSRSTGSAHVLLVTARRAPTRSASPSGHRRSGFASSWPASMRASS